MLISKINFTFKNSITSRDGLKRFEVSKNVNLPELKVEVADQSNLKLIVKMNK